jgi:hypothetical protein
MKRKKQARPESSAGTVKTQTQTSAPGATPDLRECQTAIRGAVSQIDDQLAECDSDTEKLCLLSIRQHLSPLHDYWKSAPVDVGEIPKPIQDALPSQKMEGVRPFGPLEPTDDTQMARLHIHDFFKQCERMKGCDGTSNFLCLAACMKYHPQLETETNAAWDLSNGFNGLTTLSNRHFVSDPTLTALEKWLARRLDENLQLESLWPVLTTALPMLQENPATKDLADDVAWMIAAKTTMAKVRMYLDSI